MFYLVNNMLSTVILLCNKLLQIESLKNFYTVEYWFKMIPLPSFFKDPIKFIIKLIIKEKPIGIKAGNLYLIAKKNSQ